MKMLSRVIGVFVLQTLLCQCLTAATECWDEGPLACFNSPNISANPWLDLTGPRPLNDDASDGGSTNGPRRQPNIVFILVDDLGFNDVGYHGAGGSLLETPHIDRLAKNGIRLENYYVQPSCTPTRSQLMTGRYQIHTGMQHDNLVPTSPHCLPVTETTLAQALRTAGYSTHAVGKWHLGFCRKACLPSRRGFDSYLGMILGISDHYSYTRGPGRALYFNETPLKGKLFTNIHSTYLYTQRAEEIIRYHGRPSQPPMFLFLSYQSQHTPLQVPSRYTSKFEGSIVNPNRLKYAGMMSMLDEAVHNITQSLKTNGLWKETLIIFSTDNGGRTQAGGINWPLRGEKASLWEGGIRGVAFVSGHALPARMRGKECLDLFHVSDWFPTLVRGVANDSTKYPLPLDGVNMWRTLSHGKISPRKEILHNIDPLQRPTEWTNQDMRLWGRLEDLPFNATVRAAIRNRDWKLVTGNVGFSKWTPPPESPSFRKLITTEVDTQSIRLFNIKKDPRERFNLAASKPALVHRLLARLARYQATAVAPLDHGRGLTYTRWVGGPNRDSNKRWFRLPLFQVLQTGVWGPWLDGVDESLLMEVSLLSNITISGE